MKAALCASVYPLIRDPPFSWNTGNHGERVRESQLVSARVVGTGLLIARGNKVSHSERVRRSDLHSGRGHGSTDGERAHARSESAIEAWRAAQDGV